MGGRRWEGDERGEGIATLDRFRPRLTKVEGSAKLPTSQNTAAMTRPILCPSPVQRSST